METLGRAVPVGRGADPLEDVLKGIREELARQNEAAARGDRDAAARADVLDQQAQQLAATTRGGSRYAAPGASPEVLDVLAAGGSVAEPRGWHGNLQPRSERRRDVRSTGLAGLMRKALAEVTPSAGGYLVPVEVSAEVLRMLRARSAVFRMGARVVPVKKELDVTSLSSGATAYYVAENAQIPVSEQTFAQVALLRPRELAALVPISNRLLRDADNPAADEIIRTDLAEVLALRADLAFLRGTGAAGEPLGIRNTTGLTPAPDLGANGRAPTYDDLMDTVAALRTANAPFERPGWVFHPRVLNTLEKLKDGQGQYLKDAGLLEYDQAGGGGRLLGFPFRTTTQIPVNLPRGTSTDTTDVFFSSDWQECWVGEEDTLRIETSAEGSYWAGTEWVSAFQSRQTLFRATTAHDIGLRRPQLFTVLQGVRP